ncbi:MAG: MATE family efflux transporter, partial [Bermanella sp.]
MANDLTQGAIAPWLYRLTAPMVLGILAMFLFNLVDTYFISLLGTQPLAAISFTFPVTTLVINMGIGLSIATGAVVARALGQKDRQQSKLWISSSFYLAILIALALMSIGFTLQETIFKLLG